MNEKPALTINDREGKLWLDAASPIQIMREDSAPHRISICAQSRSETDDKLKVHLRLNRSDAYRLIDELQAALDADTKVGAETVIKRKNLLMPINGGVNTETGDIILSFRDYSGLEYHHHLPFDQSGALFETLEQATKSSEEWHDANFTEDHKGIKKVNIQPREAKSIFLGEDPLTEKPILIVRLETGHQYSFLIDRKILEQIFKKKKLPSTPFKYQTDPWTSIADDIEWFEKEWCTLYEAPSDADIRRGSAALRRLLIEDWIGKAWRHFGFQKQPSIVGPDLIKLATTQGHEIRHITSVISGGATIDGIQLAMLGHARANNPTTGVSVDADEGFAVVTFSITRDARGEADEGDLERLINKEWMLSRYLDAPGMVRKGETISRRDIVTYFANVGGGVHLGPARKEKEKNYALIEELINKIGALTMDGVFFELLSIGQAIGRSNDLNKLVKEIRRSQI